VFVNYRANAHVVYDRDLFRHRVENEILKQRTHFFSSIRSAATLVYKHGPLT